MLRSNNHVGHCLLSRDQSELRPSHEGAMKGLAPPAFPRDLSDFCLRSPPLLRAPISVQIENLHGRMVQEYTSDVTHLLVPPGSRTLKVARPTPRAHALSAGQRTLAFVCWRGGGWNDLACLFVLQEWTWGDG